MKRRRKKKNLRRKGRVRELRRSSLEKAVKHWVDASTVSQEKGWADEHKDAAKENSGDK